jgi:hypothetical protein
MADDLAIHIIRMYDDDELERHTGKLVRTTKVDYLIGDFGPFREVFQRGTFTESGLEERAREMRRTLERFK